MPIYEYLCKACGHQMEAIQGFNDEPLKKCPECNKAKLEKQISKPSFHLKGTGWYVTDFKDSNKKEKKVKETKEEKNVKEDTKTTVENTPEKSTAEKSTAETTTKKT